MRTDNHGFTLIEMLVVISIIILLLGISLPAIYKSKKIARSVVCTSNLKQISIAYQAYNHDYKDEMFNYSYTFDKSWIARLSSYTSWRELRFCPEATQPNPDYKWGSDTLAWNGEFDMPDIESPNDLGNFYIGSYGFNGWLYNNASFGRKINHIKLRFRVPLFFDCIWADAWPSDTDQPLLDLTGTDTANNTARVAINRHMTAINVVTLDGSAKTVKLHKLWQLRWSSDFKFSQLKLP